MFDVWRFLTVRPLFTTSLGSRPCTVAARFCTFTIAMSGSVPWRKKMPIEPEPLFEALEVMYIMPSTPLIASSNGTTTLFCTVSALAPV